MSSDTSYVKRQLVYFAQVPLAGTSITAQFGPAALTIDVAHATPGSYTLTMPANFQVPLTRRALELTVNSPTATGFAAQYNHAGSADNTVVILTSTGAGAAGDSAFFVSIFRIEALP
jgi:hypothetical protein